MTDIKELLSERAKTHGDYTEHARVTQEIMSIIMGGRNWKRLSEVQRESLHMFAHKIGRICEGDPNHQDHWDDISGYAVLVSQRLVKGPSEVPIEDSNRHAERAEHVVSTYERSKLNQKEASRYRWCSDRCGWVLW